MTRLKKIYDELVLWFWVLTITAAFWIVFLVIVDIAFKLLRAINRS